MREKAAYKLRTILQLRERIRALEAELDKETTHCTHVMVALEDALAEVKRLQAHLSLHCHEEDATDCYYGSAAATTLKERVDLAFALGELSGAIKKTAARKEGK